MSSSVIISLSSIPPRFRELRPTLQSLLDQATRADAIELWIPRSYRRFPDWNGRLPEVPDGVSIMRCEDDHGPATKILPSLKHHAGRDVTILFCDDDRLFSADWLSTILEVTRGKPGCCIATFGRNLPLDVGLPARSAARMPRVRRVSPEEVRRVNRGSPEGPRSYAATSGFADLLHGFAGVLVRPEFFGQEVFNVPPVLWAVDDIWLSGHLERNAVPIWVDRRIPVPLERLDVMGMASLEQAVIENHDRASADRACIAYFRGHYGIWKPSHQQAFLSLLRRLKRRLVASLKRSKPARALGLWSNSS